MSLKVEWPSRLTGQLARLGLPDGVLVEVYHRLRDEFIPDPLRYLRRMLEPFDGLVYSFALIDPDNRFSEHHLYFHVFYHQDEERLIVSRVAYIRSIGIG